MIIDVHAHLGWDQVFDENFTMQEQLDKHKRFNVSKTILQPGSCHSIESVVQQHDHIAEVCRRFPNQYYMDG